MRRVFASAISEDMFVEEGGRRRASFRRRRTEKAHLAVCYIDVSSVLTEMNLYGWREGYTPYKIHSISKSRYVEIWI